MLLYAVACYAPCCACARAVPAWLSAAKSKAKTVGFATVCENEACASVRYRPSGFSTGTRRYSAVHCSCGIHAVAGCCRYKQRALECHPDKHADKSAEECAEFEKKFKLIGEALEILTDTMKRQVPCRRHRQRCRISVRS